MPLLKRMGVNAAPPLRRHPAALGPATSTSATASTRCSTTRGALRLHARRRLDRRTSTTPTRSSAPPSRPRSAALVERYKRHARAAHVAARQREQLRPLLDAPSRSRPCPRASATRPGPATSTRSSARSSATIKARDPDHPVAIANGDVQYIDLIAQECKGLDVLGTNVYRGISVRDLFQVVKDKLGVPVMFTEFGADAFNARRDARGRAHPGALPARRSGARSTSSRPARAGSATPSAASSSSGATAGGSTGQESRLDIHDTNASWPNGGYAEDFVEGENNMNEEWWGICAKGPPDARGLYELYPRAAYYALQQAFRLDPYAPGHRPRRHRARTSPPSSPTARPAARGRRRRAQPAADALERGAAHRRAPRTSRPSAPAATSTQHAAGRAPHRRRRRSRASTTWSRSTPTSRCSRPSNVTGTLSLNVLGNVPLNPIDEIFYENRGRPAHRRDQDPDGTSRRDAQRHRAGQGLPAPASPGTSRWFRLDGFYRTGHYHWGYEGDFFGLYREANYGANIDIYNGDAPIGFEITGKQAARRAEGRLRPAALVGRQPAVMVKYRRRWAASTVTLLSPGGPRPGQAHGHHLARSSPSAPTRKATLAARDHARLGVGLELAASGRAPPGSARPSVDETTATPTSGGRPPTPSAPRPR